MSVRMWAFLGGLAGAVFVGAMSAVLGASLDLTPAYPWRAVTAFVAMAVVVVYGIGGHHPFPRLGPANQATLVRAALLALVAGLLFERVSGGVAWTAVSLAIVAECLDGVDGALARHTGLASRFGARFDMETDALLILVLSALVWRQEKAGVWVLAGGLMRYAFVAAAWVLPWMARPLSPTRRGQTIAVVHTVGLIVALAPIIPYPLSAWAALATLVALTWSFAVDVGRLRRGQNAAA